MALTLRGLIDEFLKCIAFTNAPSTVEYYRTYLERFAKHVKGKQLSKLKAIHLLNWGKNWHHMQAVQRLFHWAAEEAELLTRNPFKRVKKPRTGSRKRILKPSEQARFLRKTDVYFRRFLLTMRETLARPQEVRALSWEHLRWEGEHKTVLAALHQARCYFLLEDYKSRDRRADPETPRVLFVSPRLARLLSRLARNQVDLAGLIFRNKLGRAWTGNAVRCRMRRLRRRLGLGKDHRGENVVAYTWRHTGATRAAVLGVRDRVLAELMGHTSTRTTARYQHLETGHLWDAFERLHPERTKGQKK